MQRYLYDNTVSLDSLLHARTSLTRALTRLYKRRHTIDLHRFYIQLLHYKHAHLDTAPNAILQIKKKRYYKTKMHLGGLVNGLLLTGLC